MSIYLDQAAAAYPDREVLDFYRAELEHSGANQEAAHRLGYELRRRLDAAARELSQALADRDDCTVIWGTSGTEIFNLLAGSPAVAGKRVLTSRLEHPALLAALRRSAAEVKFAPCGKDGRLQMPEDSGAELAAFHQVQSELGVRQELRPLPGVPLFVDAIQAAGKLPLPPEFDLAAVSGHKFGAPGGAALLAHPRFAGKGKLAEFAHRYRHVEYRCGRPEPALLLTLAFAATRRRAAREATLRRISELNAAARELLTGLPLPGGARSFCTVPAEAASPFILHLTLPGVQSGVVVRMLSEEDVMVAAGSACASETRTPSAALTQLGFSRELAYSGLRISFGFDTSPEDVKKMAEALKRVLKNY